MPDRRGHVRPYRACDGEAVDVNFAPLVHTSGAIYAFAPSIPGLGLLASSDTI